jgi:uncharacterized protein (TIGR03083 family)
VVDYIAPIRDESKRFYDAADGADPDARIPSCPEWSVRELVLHLAQVQYFWGALVEHGITDLAKFNELEHPASPDDYTELVALGRQMAERMATTLESADQTATVWSWADRDDVAFVTRHQVQEVAIHRWDLENALGDPSPIASDVADDAIDEFLKVSLPSRNDWKPGFDIVHLHTTDTDRDWLLEPSGNVEDRGGSADVTLSATASDLLLALYRRIPMDGIESVLGGLAFT